jgi:hypothetical protein
MEAALMKELLYKAIKDYCEENQCWLTKMTAKEWNEALGTVYSAATFTALVSGCYLNREKLYGEKAYRYSLPLTPEMIAKREEEKRQNAIKHAQWRVDNYEQQKAEQQALYDERIAEITKHREERMAWLEDEYIKAKELLASI